MLEQLSSAFWYALVLNVALVGGVTLILKSRNQGTEILTRYAMFALGVFFTMGSLFTAFELLAGKRSLPF